MKAKIVMSAHIECPFCGNAQGFSCDHILSGKYGQFGPWHCENCGHSITGKRAADGSIEIEPHPERSIKTIDLLVLPPQDKPVYFIVDGKRYERDDRPSDHDDAESKQYVYDEHSCPTNWLKPVMVYHDGDSDPHGLIQFVAFRDDATFPPDQTWGPNERDFAFVEFIDQNAAKKDRSE